MMSRLAGSLFRSRIIRFGFVGAAGYGVSLAALWAMHVVLDIPADPAYVAAFLVAVTFTWWGNRTLTFHAHAGADLLREWFHFVVANTLGFLANWALFSALVHFAPRPLDNVFVAQIAGTLLGMVFNFTLSQRFVFRTPAGSARIDGDGFDDGVQRFAGTDGEPQQRGAGDARHDLDAAAGKLDIGVRAVDGLHRPDGR
jgi:putative flippase GtrA